MPGDPAAQVLRAKVPFKSSVYRSTFRSLLTLSVRLVTRPQVLRAKGFVWLAGQPKTQGVFAFAGRAAELTPGGTWWAAMEREEWPPGVAQVR